MSERNTAVNNAKRGEDVQLRAGACRIIGCAKITSPGPPVSSTTRTASLLPQEQDWTLTKSSRCSTLTPIPNTMKPSPKNLKSSATSLKMPPLKFVQVVPRGLTRTSSEFAQPATLSDRFVQLLGPDHRPLPIIAKIYRARLNWVRCTNRVHSIVAASWLDWDHAFVRVWLRRVHPSSWFNFRNHQPVYVPNSNSTKLARQSAPELIACRARSQPRTVIQWNSRTALLA
jgi:hypothetical protein